jgi:glycyl-tRNA synthetase
MNDNDNDNMIMEKVQQLCKNRGFIFQAGELYGGVAGVYDYGPLGSLLKENIKAAWIKKFVHNRLDMFLLDSAIVMDEAPLTASGHVGGFTDPLVEDLSTQKRYRADHLLEEHGIDAGPLTQQEMDVMIKEKDIHSPEGNPLGDVQTFNLMLETKLGASEASSSRAFLRPETAQGIFLNYKNIMDSMHPKIPFGVAQIGKAYRNEITPRNFIFRLREMEQMEIEYFIHPDQWEEQFQYWQDEMREWINECGIDLRLVHEVEITGADRAHYSKRTVDFEFVYPFGQKELFGLAYRTDHDLTKHQEASKQKLIYTDPYTHEQYVPHVIEPSMGLDRTILALLLSSYQEDEVSGSTRTYLSLPHHLAPYVVSVSPLLKNKPELVDMARGIYGKLKSIFGRVSYDDNGNIGKRYRRQDEIGTPFCVVVDYDSLQDGTVSVRDRNTTEQIRMHADELQAYIEDQIQ